MSFDRAELNPRGANSKAFTPNPNRGLGRSAKEITDSYPKMKNANELANHCALYAHSYVETMILRLL